MLKKLCLIICALIGTASLVEAQGTSDVQLAQYYLDHGEFDKAFLYFDKLYDKEKNASNYSGLFKSLLELRRYDEAEKLVKQHMKRSTNNLDFIDLGSIYDARGEKDKALQAYREAIKTMPASQGMVSRTANEFVRKNLNDLALETYSEGKKMLNNQYPFSYEMAGLYGTLGNNELMISEYLDLIEFNDAYLQNVQNALSRSIDFQTDEEKIDLLRTELLRRVQRTPQNTTYAEMLTWLFLQKREFNAAFVQLKAIDKRLNENGQRLLNLASLCVSNEVFDVATKCYGYIVEKGPSNTFYSYARGGLLKSRFEQLRRAYPIDTLGLTQLQTDYSGFISELGPSPESAHLLRQKAQLEAYYLNKTEAATISLNEALDAPRLTPEERAEMKLDLARILITRDYIWDASLLASQVDKDFKNDVLGYEAKYLNARISYYNGDFQWAQAQLDVLKGSTSKLISNNAMELSLLITDNMNLDTLVEPMLTYARADLLVVQHQYVAAIDLLDRFNIAFPGHSLSDDILLMRADIAERTGDYQAAAAFYQQVLADHYFDINADNALFRMAGLYEKQLNDQEKAQELYKQLMLDFPGSLFVVEARGRFRELRGEGGDDAFFRSIAPDKIP